MMRAILFTLSTLIAAAVPAAAQEMLDGTAIEHHIDLSWNEVCTATMQVRDIKTDGDRLIYTISTGIKSAGT